MSRPFTPSARGDALGFVYQVVGQLAGLVLSVVSLTVVLRYLGRGSYGQVTAVVAFLGLWECLTDFGVGPVVVQRAARAPQRLREDVQVALGLSLSYCAALAVVAGLVTHLLYGARYPGLTAGVVVVAAGLAATTVSSTWKPLFQRSSRYLPLAAADLCARVGSVVLVVLAATADWGAAGVLAALGAGPLVRLAVLGPAARRLGAGRPVWAPRRWRVLVADALPIGAGQVVALVYYRVDAVLLSLLATSAEVGSYGLAVRLFAPVMFLPNLVLSGGLARLSAAHVEGLPAFRSLLGTLFRYVLVLAVPLVAIGIPAATALVRLIGGRDFAAADGAVRLVAVATGLVFVNAVWAVGFVAAGEQRLLLRLSLLGLAANVVANLLLIPAFGAEGAAAALTFSEALSVTVSFVALRRRTGFRPLGPRYGLLLGAGAVAFLLTLIAPTPWTVPTAVLAGVVYLGLVFGSRFVTVGEVRALLRRTTPASA